MVDGNHVSVNKKRENEALSPGGIIVFHVVNAELFSKGGL
jgi:hypothetical protein